MAARVLFIARESSAENHKATRKKLLQKLELTKEIFQDWVNVPIFPHYVTFINPSVDDVGPRTKAGIQQFLFQTPEPIRMVLHGIDATTSDKIFFSQLIRPYLAKV